MLNLLNVNSVFPNFIIPWKLHFFFKTPCPGSLAFDFPRGDFCRVIALSDGTVINQEAVTETLCRLPSVKYTKGRIGQDFLDTKGGKIL